VVALFFVVVDDQRKLITAAVTTKTLRYEEHTKTTPFGRRFRLDGQHRVVAARSIAGVPAILQPVAHILLQVRESVGEIVEPLTERDWNARPAGVASAAFHVRHIAGVIDRLFTYARGHALSPEQFAAIQSEGQELLAADVAAVLDALSSRVDAGVAELRTIDVATLDDFRGVGRAQLPSTVIGCLVHGAEHAMRHVGQLSVTARIVRSDAREAEARRGHSHD